MKSTAAVYRVLHLAVSLLWIAVSLGAAASAQDAPPSGGVPANLLEAEPPMPLVVYTKDIAPATPGLEDLPLRQSIYRYGITWTFDKPARAGRFVNGDWYVVGPVTVVDVNPKPLLGDEVKDPSAEEQRRFKGSYCRNGSVLNVPVVGFQSGFDSRVPHGRYKPDLTARLPIRMNPGDALVSSISLEKPTDRPIRSFSILTCLKEPVPPDAFRPGYCDRGQAIHLARNLRRDLLPRLPLPPSPRPEDMANLRIRTYPPKLKDVEAPFLRPWLELNFFEGDQAQYQGGGYGRAVAEMVGRASLMLMLDFKPEEKESLQNNLIQYGLDLFALVRNGFPGWVAHGGWGSGRKWPIVFAGIMLGDDAMAAINRTCPKAAFQEDMQTMYDDCWTGARVVYFGHVGTRALREERTPPGWGPYEHLHPSRWVQWIGTSYRTNMTSNTWVAESLAIRILQAEKQWGHDAFLDYCDRWMTEPHPGYGNDSAAFSYQGNAWDPFFKAMWTAYRNALPAVAGREGTPRPPTGWVKERTLKSPAVEIGRNRELRVAGKPFFPLMVFAFDPARIDDAVAIGANVLAEGNFEPYVTPPLCVSNKEFLDRLAEKGLYGVFGADARTVGHPALLGWIHLDAPDRALEYAPKERANVFPSYGCVGWAIRNDPLQKERDEALVLVEPAWRWMKKMDRSRPVFLTLSPSFMKGEGKIDPAVREKLYPEYLKSCDAVGCAVYPVTAWNAPAKLDRVADAVTELRRLAGPAKPVYAWIETRSGDKSVNPAYVRAEAWMAVIRGATGLGYRGYETRGPAKQDPAMVAELRKLNDRLTRLAPAILADASRVAVAITMADDLASHARATDLDGTLHIFAQNIDLGPDRDKLAPGQDIAPRAGSATITVEGLKAGTVIEVVDESRTITAGDGRFTDDFGPLAEHVYKLRP